MFRNVFKTLLIVTVIVFVGGFFFKAFAEPKQIDEKITVVNETDIKIEIVKCKAIAEGKKETSVSFGPIPAKGSASGTLKVWNTGSFTVEAVQKMQGKEVTTAPFKAVLNETDPITPVTLTLKSIPWGQSGTKSLWQGVDWEMPKDMK